MVLSLYRAILRAHRLYLPRVQRDLGDKYVKQEFRAHKDSNPEFVETFTQKWKEYLKMLRKQAEAPAEIQKVRSLRIGKI